MLGFSLLEDSFQFVEVQHKDGKPFVKQFAKRSTPFPFTQKTILDSESKEGFRKLIEEAINFYQLNGPVSLTLDSKFAIVRKVMIDSAISDDQIDDQIKWEIRQIIQEDSLFEIQYVYEELPDGFYEDQKSFLLVVFRKEILEAIKSLFTDTSLFVQFIELDLFSALYAVDRLFGIKEKGICCLVDPHKDYIKFFNARQGEFFDFYKLSLENESEVETTNSAENLANLINKEIRRKLLEYNLESKEDAIDVLFFYGEKANSSLIEKLENNGPAKEVVFVEPFKKLDFNPDIEDLSETAPTSSEYTVCVGSALRSVT